jgi:hypothetical protein
MAKRTEKTENVDFGVSVVWPATRVSGTDPVLDASVGRMGIVVRDVPVTKYQRDKGDTADELNFPLYGIAEWVAQNWWSLLYEPKKIDQAEDDDDFRSRHWLGTARNGFALPDMWFFPAGEQMEIQAYETYLRFARLSFLNSVNASVPLDSVVRELQFFVEYVLTHMSQLGVSDTDAHRLWDLVRNTTADEEQYCRLVGSLGPFPYEDHPEIDQVLDALSTKLDQHVLADLCQASDSATLRQISGLAEKIYSALPDARNVGIAELTDIDLPQDYSAQAWRWGVEATSRVREAFGISALDPHGGSSFFEKLRLDPNDAITVDADDAAAVQVSAAFNKHSADLRLVLADSPEPQLRFATARAAFLAWSSPTDTSRLVTRARTREQQASRAFAAEILAPIGYIRKRAGGSGVLSSYRADEIANELKVSPWVVQYQAKNT